MFLIKTHTHTNGAYYSSEFRRPCLNRSIESDLDYKIRTARQIGPTGPQRWCNAVKVHTKDAENSTLEHLHPASSREGLYAYATTARRLAQQCHDATIGRNHKGRRAWVVVLWG